MRPEFVQALNNCLNFSHEKGRSVNLLKTTSKRKRLRTEIEEVKEEEYELKSDRQKFLQEFKRLKREKEQLEQGIIELTQANQELAQLYGPENLEQQQVEFQF